MYCSVVQGLQPLSVRHTLMNEMGIQGFQVGQADQLRNIGFIADIALATGVFIPPLLGGFTEQRHVQQVGFAGVNLTDLLRCQRGRNQFGFDRIGVNAVVDLGQVAADVPTQLGSGKS